MKHGEILIPDPFTTKDRIGAVGETWEDTYPESFTMKDRIGTVCEMWEDTDPGSFYYEGQDWDS